MSSIGTWVAGWNVDNLLGQSRLRICNAVRSRLIEGRPVESDGRGPRCASAPRLVDTRSGIGSYGRRTARVPFVALRRPPYPRRAHPQDTGTGDAVNDYSM